MVKQEKQIREYNPHTAGASEGWGINILFTAQEG